MQTKVSLRELAAQYCAARTAIAQKRDQLYAHLLRSNRVDDVRILLRSWIYWSEQAGDDAWADLLAAWHRLGETSNLLTRATKRRYCKRHRRHQHLEHDADESLRRQSSRLARAIFQDVRSVCKKPSVDVPPLWQGRRPQFPIVSIEGVAIYLEEALADHELNLRVHGANAQHTQDTMAQMLRNATRLLDGFPFTGFPTWEGSPPDDASSEYRARELLRWLRGEILAEELNTGSDASRELTVAMRNAFVPTPKQDAILAALDGKALHADALAKEAGLKDRRHLYDKSRGRGKPKTRGPLPKLIELGMVAVHPRLGYFRPDAPPPELTIAENGAAPQVLSINTSLAASSM